MSVSCTDTGTAQTLSPNQLCIMKTDVRRPFSQPWHYALFYCILWAELYYKLHVLLFTCKGSNTKLTYFISVRVFFWNWQSKEEEMMNATAEVVLSENYLGKYTLLIANSENENPLGSLGFSCHQVLVGKKRCLSKKHQLRK